jgi:hypothetical protein
MKRLIFTLACLFLASGLAQADPASTVESLYSDWLSQPPRKVLTEFLNARRSSFSDEFFKEFSEVAAMTPQTHTDYLNFDPFVGGQVEFFSYQVQEPVIEGDRATVPVFVRIGLSRDRSEVEGRRVILANQGGRWVITDIDFGDHTLGEQLKIVKQYSEKRS